MRLLFFFSLTTCYIVTMELVPAWVNIGVCANSVLPSNISISILGENSSGIIVMRPGESRSVTLALINQGEGAQFSLTVRTVAMGTNCTNNTTFINYNLTPNATFLQQNSSTEINVEIILSNDTTDGQTVSFTVIAESVIERNINDFINFDVIATTRPPPEFTENSLETTEHVIPPGTTVHVPPETTVHVPPETTVNVSEGFPIIGKF